MSAGRRLAELSGPAAAAALGPGSVVVLPTGAVEHHGPHLPLLTDQIMADRVAAEAVDRAAAAGVDAWVLPTLAYTKSDEHAWAPGTMWLRAETFLQTVVDLGRSVAAAGAERLVFLNGHGGNVAPLGVALREVRRLTGLRTFLVPALVAAPPPDGEGLDELGLGIHGGAAETSMLLHLRPDLVDLSTAERWVPEHLAASELIGFHGKPVTFGWLSDDFGPAGVLGDPTQATAAYGARLYEASVALAVAALTEIAAFHPLGPGHTVAGGAGVAGPVEVR
ncbi:creatininase family protein [Cellulomonas marina]|uniref:Creatinine amidohydrolase n=1 Tax=Cellulomonas marina TaxID=988821 RepID=A0A1I0V7Z7_9CELL|nr:creatininase family protein [Cellulomonas marina]GIG29230.1 creatinine amidohydrolase [Cellulomonas marina]SFA72455.1 creatinine amidohydrolase [Cellulomonas marina]